MNTTDFKITKRIFFIFLHIWFITLIVLLGQEPNSEGYYSGSFQYSLLTIWWMSLGVWVLAFIKLRI